MLCRFGVRVDEWCVSYVMFDSVRVRSSRRVLFFVFRFSISIVLYRFVSYVSGGVWGCWVCYCVVCNVLVRFIRVGEICRSGV